MTSPTFKERVTGAIMGAFIGDALGLGPHWYYNLDELRSEYGDWIDNYTDPKPDRYHGGMKAGQISQSGIILKILLQSLVEKGEYDQDDFCRRMDNDLFPLLDGSPEVGPGGYTSQSIRETWELRVEKKLPWGKVAGHTDNTEAAERVLALAVRYALKPQKLAETVVNNTMLFQRDEVIVAMTLAYGALLGLLIQGHTLDDEISGKLMDQVKSGDLPFHAITVEGSEPPGNGRFASPDALLTPSSIAKAAFDEDIRIEPASKIALLYGLPCAVYHQFPATYYLASRFKNDFESAVLHAINGGGQNMARAMLTGALAGAQTGIQGIPQKFIDGLEETEELYELAQKIAEQASANQGPV